MLIVYVTEDMLVFTELMYSVYISLKGYKLNQYLLYSVYLRCIAQFVYLAPGHC